MKKYIKPNIRHLVLGALLLTILGSCVKSRSGETDFSGLKPIVMIREGGMQNFSNSALTFPSSDNVDTAYFRVNYAATNVAPKDITVQLGFDSGALNTYNNSGGTQYAKFPDSIYSFPVTSVTIKAGQSFSDLIPFVVYPSKIDPTKNYMFPVSIISAGGINISGNFSTVYYHLIGNPIAGAYQHEWLRWSKADSTGTPNFDVFSSTVFAPSDPTTINVSSGTGVSYILSFTDSAGVPTNFAVAFPSSSSDPGSPAHNGITITGGPTIERADPKLGVYRFTFTYLNGSGAPRVIVDQFTK